MKCVDYLLSINENKEKTVFKFNHMSGQHGYWNQDNYKAVVIFGGKWLSWGLDIGKTLPCLTLILVLKNHENGLSKAIQRPWILSWQFCMDHVRYTVYLWWIVIKLFWKFSNWLDRKQWIFYTWYFIFLYRILALGWPKRKWYKI